MSIHARLLEVIRGMPSDGSVTFTVAWISHLLEEHTESDDGPDLRVDDVARSLDRAGSTVRSWLGQGRLPGAYRLRDREWRIPRTALRNFLDSEANGSASSPIDGDSDLGAWRRVRQ